MPRWKLPAWSHNPARNRRCHAVAANPPSRVATNPVTTSVPPKKMLAFSIGIPCTRKRKVGAQNWNPPSTKVYAVYPNSTRL